MANFSTVNTHCEKSILATYFRPAAIAAVRLAIRRHRFERLNKRTNLKSKRAF
jgi:hypothetical protein